MNCPGCYKETKEGYCVTCRKKLFDGTKISPVLPFDTPQPKNLPFYQEQAKRLSISGVQLKFSLQLQGKQLVMQETGGEYILKPIPPTRLFAHMEEMPENEHLTMQIAEQVFKMKTAANGLIYFQDGGPAYITKRFDRKGDGSKFLQEDFAQISGRTKQTHGDHYKYDGTYEEIGVLIRQYVAAYMPALEIFFQQVLFNYVFSNGDAHLKNFSLTRLETGEYGLTPAYDLMCTVLHTPGEEDTALDFFDNDHNTEFYRSYGYYGKPDFLELAFRLGLLPLRVKRMLDAFVQKQEAVYQMIERSFLSAALKEKYRHHFDDKIKRLDQRS